MSLNLHDFLDLVVPEYTLIAFTLLAVFLLTERDLSKLTYLLFPVIAYVFSLFGFNSLNQVLDVKIDKISKPLRPIPSGRVKIGTAKIFSFGCFIISFLAAAVSQELLFVLIVFVIFILLYSHPLFYLRKYSWSTPFFGAVFYAIIPFLAVTQYFRKDIDWFFLLFFAGLVASISIIKDIEDSGAEKRFGIHSIPNSLGGRKTILLSICSLISIVMFFIILTVLGVIANYFLVPLLAALLGVVLTYFLVMKRENKEKVITQSKIVSIFMILIIIIQLLMGFSSFLSKI